MENIGKFIVWLILTAASIFLKALAVVKLWGWFIVPFGIIPIGYAWGLGFSLFVNFITFQYDPSLVRDTENNSAFTPILVNIVISLLALLGGWIYHSFM